MPQQRAALNERVKQLLVLGREHYAKREFEKAEQMLRMVLEEEDRYADVHDMLGVIAHSRGNFLVAERHFERVLTLDKEDSYSRAAYADLSDARLREIMITETMPELARAFRGSFDRVHLTTTNGANDLFGFVSAGMDHVLAHVRPASDKDG